MRDTPEPPFGAIDSGKELFRRLVEHYDFKCEAGPLVRCIEFDQLKACFDAMAEYIEDVGDGWEPSESQQGLIPIPREYNEQ